MKECLTNYSVDIFLIHFLVDEFLQQCFTRSFIRYVLCSFSERHSRFVYKNKPVPMNTSGTVLYRDRALVIRNT